MERAVPAGLLPDKLSGPKTEAIASEETLARFFREASRRFAAFLFF